MKPIFISCFTPGPYEREADELRRTLDEFKLEHDIRPIPNLKKWVRNCSQKPCFIRDRMLDHGDRPVVWLDADARVKSDPKLFNELKCDFAAHWFSDNIASGTLYFAPTSASWKIVSTWCDVQKRNPDKWDQHALDEVLRELHRSAMEMIIQILPPTYCWIQAPNVKVDISEDFYGSSHTPVIVHEQASRRYKK